MGDRGAARPDWLLFALAAATFLLLLNRVQYTGEEAVYSVEAYEQWYAHDWLRPTFLGGAYQRPPLFTDLIALLSALLGWSHCLAAARLVSSLATVLSGLLVARFARALGASAERAAFTGLTFLTLAEPLFYYGWLGYSDALFGALTLAAMLACWHAVRLRQSRWLLLAVLLADAAFLTKALTAYVFLGVTGLACLWHHRAWSWLRQPAVWCAALLPLAVPVLWYALAPSGGTMAHGMVSDITEKLGQHGVSPYLRHFVSYPLNALLNLLPAAGVVLWAMARARRDAGAIGGAAAAAATTADPAAAATTADPLRASARLAGLIALLNFLPYWLAPQSGPRYLMPLYGLMALWLAGQLWTLPQQRRWLRQWACVAIALKLLAALWLFPAYTARVRPDLAALAAEVERQSSGKTLYADTDAWVGISVAALHDITPGPEATARPPLQRPPRDWNNALVLSDHDWSAAAPSRLVIDLGGVRLYCRGSACP